jgi:ribosome recycling factor
MKGLKMKKSHVNSKNIENLKHSIRIVRSELNDVKKYESKNSSVLEESLKQVEINLMNVLQDTYNLKY